MQMQNREKGRHGSSRPSPKHGCPRGTVTWTKLPMRPPVPPAEEVGARSTMGHPQRPDPQTRVTFLFSGWQGLWFKTVLTSVPKTTRMRSSELPT